MFRGVVLDVAITAFAGEGDVGGERLRGAAVLSARLNDGKGSNLIVHLKNSTTANKLTPPNE